MQASEQSRFDALYAKHVTALKLQRKADKTIDSYARAVRRVARAFDRCPDDLSIEELRLYLADYVASHSYGRNSPAWPLLPARTGWLTARRIISVIHSRNQILAASGSEVSVRPPHLPR